jgi:AcrR family transcriptional regulator
MTTQTIEPGESAARTTGFNHLGQRIGSKGERTRQLLIETTVALLETHGLRDVQVVDVARAAKTSPATFYVYFRGVPEVVLAALESASQTSPELEALAGQDWLADDAAAQAKAFVDAYTELWNRNRTIFCVRNLAAEEGDERFYQARMAAAAPMLDALAGRVALAQVAGRIPSDLSARACAGTLLMLLERLAAIGPIARRTDGIDYPTLKAATAHAVGAMLGAHG